MGLSYVVIRVRLLRLTVKRIYDIHPEALSSITLTDMMRLVTISLLCIAFVIAVGCWFEKTSIVDPAKQVSPTQTSTLPSGYRGIVVGVSEVSEQSIQQWQKQNWQHVVLMLDDESDSAKVAQAGEKIRAAKLAIEYFWEIARSPKLANEHPQWMASLQGHDEWRRLFPDFPATKSNEVAKTYPWVPVCYQESFDAQFNRISERLNGLPEPDRVWLHDLQAAPSACGCGHPLCRWTGDYGPIHTAEPLGDSAAADFVTKLNERFPKVEFVPIWVTECEEEDEHEACGGVGCFDGICWKAWTRQLSAIEQVSPVLGVSCFFKAHERNLPRFGETAAWIKSAVSFFETVPAKKKSSSVKPDRLVVVLQGWDVSREEITAQVSKALASKARGILLVQPKVDQSWEPRLYTLPKDIKSDK